MILAAKNLSKSYKKKSVLTDVSISVKNSEIIGLLGTNGSGKTTCFYMMLGLIPVDNGSISINNTDIASLPTSKRAKYGLGYLPQESSIFRTLSAQDNIKAILELRKELTRQQRQAKLEELLAEFNIAHIRNSLGISLSGGERRRVEIARAIAANPKFILLDEPFAGVDPISIADIKAIISYLRASNIGVLITDHNVRETLDLCDRSYIIHQGKVIASGASTELMGNSTVKQVYLGENFSL